MKEPRPARPRRRLTRPLTELRQRVQRPNTLLRHRIGPPADRDFDVRTQHALLANALQIAPGDPRRSLKRGVELVALDKRIGHGAILHIRGHGLWPLVWSSYGPLTPASAVRGAFAGDARRRNARNQGHAPASPRRPAAGVIAVLTRDTAVKSSTSGTRGVGGWHPRAVDSARSATGG